MIKSTLEEWLSYIQTLHSKIIDLSLDRIQEVAISLNVLHCESYIILVGGTNGKGTTCCLLENILLNNNITVGLYTSPHVLCYKERIRVCGRELSDSMHIEAMSAVEQARNGISLTYFEFITLSALYIYKRFKLDVIIFEVGLGGRLDATNIIEPNISVITNFAIDHVDFLGSNRNDIAVEKSGIFRSYKPAIIGDNNCPNIVKDIAKCKKTILFLRGRDWNFYIYDNIWFWRDRNCYKFLKNLPLSIIPIENAAVVLSILYWMPFPIFKKSIIFGLRNISLLGRFQIVNYRPLIILDVGHNPHAADYIVKRLRLLLYANKIKSVRVIFGMLKNKDIRKTISCLNKIVTNWYYSELNTCLSFDISQVFDYFNNFNVQYFFNIEDAWRKAIIDASEDDCILVFGSFYTVAPILRLLMNY